MSLEQVKARLIKENHRQLNDLRKMQRLSFPLKTLLHHDFFVSLRRRKPEFLSPESKRRKLAFESCESKEGEVDFLMVSPKRYRLSLYSPHCHSSPKVEKVKKIESEIKKSPFREVSNENRANFNISKSLSRQYSLGLVDSPSFRNSANRTKASQPKLFSPKLSPHTNNTQAPPRLLQISPRNNTNGFSFPPSPRAALPNLRETETPNFTQRESPSPSPTSFRSQRRIIDVTETTPENELPSAPSGKGRDKRKVAPAGPVRRSARLHSRYPR